MTDLGTRLERLVDEATGAAVVPDPAVVRRRGRRRRGRRVTGIAVVAALMAAALIVPGGVGELPGRLGLAPDRAPATEPGGDPPIGFAGYWYGRIDATVYLSPSSSGNSVSPPPATDGQREAVRDRLESLEVVDEVFHETSAEAYTHFREQFKGVPELLENVVPESFPETFRVRLDDPASYGVLEREICPELQTRQLPTSCMPGVDVVVDQNAGLRSLLGDYWPGRTDVSVFLTMDVTAAQRQALRDHLEAVEQVDEVFYESPEEAASHSSEEVRDLLDRGTVLLPSSFRVSLRRPVTGDTVQAFIDAFCDSRRTGDCAPGVAMVLRHPRR